MKNFISFTQEQKDGILNAVSAALTAIESAPDIQAQAFPIRVPAITSLTGKGEEIAGVCVVAFGPLAVLVGTQIGSIPLVYEQMRIMHDAQQIHGLKASGGSDGDDDNKSRIIM